MSASPEIDARIVLEDRKIAAMKAIGTAWDQGADVVLLHVKSGRVQIETGGDWRLTRSADAFPPLVGDA